MKITIEGNHVELVDGVIHDTVAADKFAAALFGSNRPQSGILPPAVRWISRSGTSVICERPPFVANIRLRLRKARVGRTHEWDKAEGVEEFRIPIPWTVYALKFTDSLHEFLAMQVFARSAPIFTEEDSLSELWVPNLITMEQVACLPDNTLTDMKRLIEKNPAWSLSDAVTFLINQFWESEFNADWQLPMSSKVPVEIPGYTAPPPPRTLDATATDWLKTYEFLAAQPLPEVLSWELRPNRTVRSLMEQLDKNPLLTHSTTAGMLRGIFNRAKITQ